MVHINVGKEEILDYHSTYPKGKIGTCVTKPLATLGDVISAYTPGVGVVCEAIHQNPASVYTYTGKGNLLGVISNGTAVLGYGNIGPLAAKPVMEAKAMFFKHMAGINAIDIELNVTSAREVIQVIQALAPTFGALNLEDIKAPECFEIEEALINNLDIPVMHDDQHATAIVVCAALLNALELVGKKLSDVQIVFSGAGASAIASADLLVELGVSIDHIVMCDTSGVITKDRANLWDKKGRFATERKIRTLGDAIQGADVFIGLSVGNVLTLDHIRSMATKPIVFALANPVPEIAYECIMSMSDQVLFATGRGDYPNQINNLLAFPYVFRGAMDVGASRINTAMKKAAVYAIAQLARQEAPGFLMGYYAERLAFGPNYILPKVLDPRLLTTISPAVARAAIDASVAREVIVDWDRYAKELEMIQQKNRSK